LFRILSAVMNTNAIPSHLTAEAFWELVGREETGVVDFKEQLPKPGRLQEPCVAFANHRGGIVVVGVSNRRPHVVVGTAWNQDAEERVQEAVRATQPPLSIEVHPLLVAEERVVILRVLAVPHGWVQTSDGRVLVRSGPTNRALMGMELLRFLRERSSEPVEDEIARGAAIADLDRAIVRKYLRARLPGNRNDVSTALRDLGWTDARGRVRLATVLVFGREPQRDNRRFGIDVLRFEGTHGTAPTLRRRMELRGAIPTLVELADRAIYEEMRRDAVVRGLVREEVPEFPPVVVREALLNAVAHRDYSARGAAVQVRLYDDALEIESPGTLPGYVTIETLRESQYSRNERIMDALHRLGLVEEAGQGIDRMFTEMEDALLDPPEFEEREASFVVRLKGTTLFTADDRLWAAQFASMELPPDAKMALVYVRRNGTIQNEDLRKLRGLDRDSSRAVLQNLVARGLLERTGERRGSRYVLGAVALKVREISSNQQLQVVLKHARRQGTIVNADVRGLLDVDDAAARKLLSELVASGLLEPVGERRGRRYLPTSRENEAARTAGT
jgi:ATP-dependent DNA helicase RecG